ncbi:MAG: DMT family transporter [Betaproteobacteria bacterium]|nr:DMT family transporter [Betaproteobacteria bacterium]
MTAGTIAPRLAVILLLAIATTFASNHVAARIAFEHGTSVTTAVVVRSCCTTLFVYALLRAQGVVIALQRPQLFRVLGVGVLIAVQSYCLYASVARIHVALALLAFNTYPMVFALVSWVAGGDRPSRRALIAMPVALVGLMFALDAFGQASDVASRWAEIGAGVGWALAASFSFALVLYFSARSLKDVDGRLRTFYTMGVAAVLVAAAGAATGSFDLPHDGPGWLGLALLTLLYGSAFTTLFVVLPRIRAVNNAVVMNFEPIAALILGWMILGQSVAPLQIFGAFIVVGAIVYLGTARQ